MADLRIGNKSDKLLPEVDPAGKTVDDIFYTEASDGKTYKIVHDGRYRAMGMPLVKNDGTDMAAILQTIIDHAGIPELIFDDGDITITGTLNGNDKLLIFRNGARLIGSGNITNFKYECADTKQCFGTSLTITHNNDFISAMHFGLKPDYNAALSAGTDNYAAFLKAYNSFPTGKTVAIYFPQPNVINQSAKFWGYRFGTNLGTLDKRIKFWGEGLGTCLFFNGAQLGIQVNADYSAIRFMSIFGSAEAESTGYNSATAHGVWISSVNSIIEGCQVNNFDGDGILLAGDVSRATNSNLSKSINNVTYSNGRAGQHTQGGDGNAQSIFGYDTEGNGRFGLWIEDFLGNTFIGGHSSSNANAHTLSKTIVTYGGNNYWAIADNINVTPGTDEGKWLQVGIDPYHAHAWSSATQYYSGCGHYINNASQRGVFIGPYEEGDELGVINNSKSLLIGNTAAQDGLTKGGIGYWNESVAARNWAARKTDSDESYIKISGDEESITWGGNATYPMGLRKSANGSIVSTFNNTGNSGGFRLLTPAFAAWASMSGRDRGLQDNLVATAFVNGAWLGKLDAAGAATGDIRMFGFASAPPTSGEFAVDDILFPTAAAAAGGVLYWQCTTGSTAGTGAVWAARMAGSGGGGAASLAQYQVGVGDAGGLLSGTNDLKFQGGILNINHSSLSVLRHLIGGSTVVQWEVDGSGMWLYHQAAGKYVLFIDPATGAMSIDPTTGTATGLWVKNGAVRAKSFFVNNTGANEAAIQLMNSIDEQGYIEYSGTSMNIYTASVVRAVLNAAGLKVPALAGTGDRYIGVSSTGQVKEMADPSGSGSPTTGTYTPTLTAVANVSSLTVAGASYIDYGDYVEVTLKVSVTPTSTGGNEFAFTLPVASVFGFNHELIGSGNGSTGIDPAFVEADTVNSRARVVFAATNTVARAYNITARYKVTPP